MKSSNGCIKCLQPGISYRATEDCKLLLIYLLLFLSLFILKAGVQHIYPYDIKNPNGPLRNRETYLQDVKRAVEINDTINGVKGDCCLNYLKYFNAVESTCIDYMHSLLGVVKNFFNHWFNSKIHSEYSFVKYMQEIDNRSLAVQPPKYVPITPRTIYSFNIWRAHEYCTFILYYAFLLFLIFYY